MSHNPNLVMKPDLRILACLIQIATKHGRTWCYPNHQTILARLKQFHGLVISVRTLCRHLAALTAQGYIKRIRRHTRADTGMLILKSTVYVTQDKCRSMMHAFGKLARHFSTEIVDKFVNYAVPNPANKAKAYYLINNFERRKGGGARSW